MTIAQDFLPEIEVPVIVINTVYPSGTPEDVREKITIPLESSLSSVNGLKEMRSVSRSSISTIELFFEWGVNVIESELQVREVIDSAYALLPKEASKPQVIPRDPNNETLMVLGIHSSVLTPSRLKKMVEDEIKIELQKVDGVGSVNLIGGREEEVQFLLKPGEMSHLGITPETLSGQFSKDHLRYPAGSFTTGDKEFLVIGDSWYTSLQELNALRFYTPKGSQIPLSEVAEARFKEKKQQSAFFFNTKEGIGLEIKKRAGSSQREVSLQVKEVLQKIEKQYSTSFDLTLIYDKSTETEQITMSIVQSLLLGALISFVLLFLITNRVLTSTLLVITLPVTLLITFLVMEFLGMSINMMSLGGVAIALGMLVDNGVIVLENINRNPSKPLYTSVKEVAKANVASTFTTIVVFIPLILLPGIIGVIYKELALTVSISLAVSCLVSVSLVPALYGVFNRRNRITRPMKLFRGLNALYIKSLKFILRRRYIMPLVLLLTGFALWYSASFVQVELTAPEENPRIELDIQMPSGSSMTWLKERCISVSELLAETDYFDGFWFRIGAEGGDMDFFGNPRSSSVTIYGTLLVKEEYRAVKGQIINRLKKTLFYTGGKVEIKEPQDSVSRLLGNGEHKYNWLITSADREVLNRTLTELEEREELSVYPSGKSRSVEILPKRENISRSGLNPQGLFMFIRSYLSGIPSGTILIDGESYDIRFVHKDTPQVSVDQLKELRMPLDKDKSIKVGDYADFQETEQNKLLYRENKNDVLLVSSNTDVDFSFLKEGESLEIHSVTGSILEEKFREILLIFLLAVLFIYLFLGAQFESFRIPLLLLITLPLSFLGVEFILIFTETSLNLNSALGILVLSGIVVNNSIVLKEKTDQLMARGKSRGYAVLISSAERYLPILITSLTTVLSLLPIALELFGSNGSKGMAWVIIGGMISSTFLTLFLVPSLTFRKKRHEK